MLKIVYSVRTRTQVESVVWLNSARGQAGAPMPVSNQFLDRDYIGEEAIPRLQLQDQGRGATLHHRP